MKFGFELMEFNNLYGVNWWNIAKVESRKWKWKPDWEWFNDLKIIIDRAQCHYHNIIICCYYIVWDMELCDLKFSPHLGFYLKSIINCCLLVEPFERKWPISALVCCHHLTIIKIISKKCVYTQKPLSL